MSDHLSSPVDTLSYSLEHPSVSLHDLLDAYATFTNRVALHARDTPPATTALKTYKDGFVRALRRDLRRALMDLPDHEDVSHHALRALATIFQFRAFYSVFSEHDLSSLFSDVIDLCLAERPPSTKTLSLSFSALSCHYLPLAVFSSRQDDLLSVLQRCLGNTRQSANIVGDCLKVISYTILHYQSAFLPLLSPLLPLVLKNIFCESHELRPHASLALASFANALVLQPEFSLTKWVTLSNHVVSFLESYCGKSFEDTSFSRIVRAVFSTESPSLAPTWILAVLASLIILCGPTLYERPTVLRFILQSLAMALTHKRSVLRALHPHVWRCLLWTFGQMLLSPENVEPAEISLSFHVIKQEVSGGIGIALASLLLSERTSTIRSDKRGERVSQALSVIKAMVQTECKHTRLEGFMFLRAFSNDAQVRHQITQNMPEIPASVLFNGAIIDVEWNNLPAVIHSIPSVPVVVHWLEESEIARHYKTLLVIWKRLAIKANKSESDSNLVHVWSSILRACSHQLESGQHVPTTEVLRCSAETIVEFLPSVPLEGSQPDWRSWDVDDQLCRLGFINKLWSAMQQAFISLSLEKSAELILTSILKHPFHVLDLGVRTSWGILCISLIVTAPPSFLRDIHDLTAPQLLIRSQRELWGVVATSLSPREHGLERKELVKFLVLPICSWVLSNPELEAWKTLLRNAITASEDPTIVAEVLQYLQGREVQNWESIIPVLGFLLTSTHEHGNAPSDEFLSMLNACLTVAYGRAHRSPEALTHSLGLLNIIHGVVVSDPIKVMYILRALSSSLCLWIEDHSEVMSNDEFNSVAVPMYCDTLKGLEDLPLSIQSLQDMGHFLASAFSRIPTPAIAPFAFERFWRATYHRRSEFSDCLPPKIKSCLICFASAYGGDLADGLSLTTGSQSQSVHDKSQALIPLSRSHQTFSEVSHRNCSPLDTAIWSKVTETDPALLCDDTFQPTVLRQLQEYSSRMDEELSEGSVIHLPSISPRSAIPSLPSFKKIAPCAPSQKRRIRAENAAPRKQSRTTRATLCATRKFESEPATRDVTPTDVPRTRSQSLGKRMVFDGVQVPVLHTVRRRQRTEMSRDAVSAEQAPSPRRRSRTASPVLPSSVGSDDDVFDGHDLYTTPSEIDVDRSLMASSPRASSPHSASADFCPTSRSEPDDVSHPPGSSLVKAMSQNDVSPSAPPRPSLQRAKTLARLDALRDVYSAVANGASQIPMSELLQATRLVHQIGAVLTDQMGKKMSDR